MQSSPRAEDTAVLLVAAGQGARAGGGLAKQWRDLGGAMVAAHTVAAFRAAGLSRLLLVLRPEDAPRAETLALPWVAGAESRAGSVRAGLAALAADPPRAVLIHDAARPLVTPALIARVLAALATHPGAAPALPVTDALWRGEGGAVTGTLPRAGLFRAQTPQGFRFPDLLAAHRAHEGEAEDDVAVARAAGLAVAIVAGEEDNMKLTFPGDFARAEAILERRRHERQL